MIYVRAPRCMAAPSFSFPSPSESREVLLRSLWMSVVRTTALLSLRILRLFFSLSSSGWTPTLLFMGSDAPLNLRPIVAFLTLFFTSDVCGNRLLDPLSEFPS